LTTYPGAQSEFINRHLQQLFRSFFYNAVTLDVFGSHLGIGMDTSLLEALKLDGAGRIDPMANHRRGFTRIACRQILVAQRRHLDLDVDAVQQRTGDSGAVTLNLRGGAAAFFLGAGEKSARALMHGLFAT